MRLLALILMLIYASPAFACPCGCGSISVGTLEPGQKAKAVTTFTHESGVSTITPSGKTIPDYFYDRTQRYTAALTYMLAPRWTTTAGMGAYQNHKGSRSSRFMAADASLALGYNILQEDFSQPLQPRIDLFVSSKLPLSKSFQEAEKNPSEESFLEVGGNGLTELAFGVQSLHSLSSDWVAGSSATYVAFPSTLSGKDVGPQAGGKIAAQITRVLLGEGGITLETGVEWLGKTVDDGTKIPGSERRVDHVALGATMVVRTAQSLGVNYSRKNVFGLTRNSVGGNSLSLSYQWLFF